MQRAIHLFLGAGIVAPLNRCRPRCYSSPSSLSGISRLPNPSKGRSFPPILPHPPRLTLRTPVLRPLSRRGSRSMTISADGSDSGQGHSADAAPTSSSGVATQKVQKPKASFCQSCGGPTNHIVPNGEEKLRAVCTVCGKIHYENPKMVVGCLVENEGKILLCKRNIEPSIGLWTLPAGYLEIGESAAEGAIRETLEEACADVEVLNPFAQLDIPLIGQSYIIFRARLRKPQFSPGPESSECAFFNLEDIPFDSLAFSSITVTLKLYIDDVKAGSFKFHYCTIMKRPGASPSDSRGFDLGCHLQS